MALKINNRKEHSPTDTGIFFKLLSDELLLLSDTINAAKKTAKGRHSKKSFLQQQHSELKQAIDRIAEHIAAHTRKTTDPGDPIKTLLSGHESIISYYREQSSPAGVKLRKDSRRFINGLLEEHEKMAWALRAQLK